MNLIQVVSQAWLEKEGKKEERKLNMIKMKGIRIEEIDLVLKTSVVTHKVRTKGKKNGKKALPL